MTIVPCRHVADDAGHERLARRRERAQADLNQELLSRFSPPPQLAVETHRPRAGRLRVRTAIGNVMFAEAFGDEHLHPAIEQFIARILKHFLGQCVDPDDHAFAVDDDDCVGSRLKKSLEVLVETIHPLHKE
jgi:hypothetical protein